MAFVVKEEVKDQQEIRLALHGAECQKLFLFTLHSNHIEVEPSEVNVSDGFGLVKKPWYEVLTDKEKLRVFNSILAEYRERSVGDKNFKLAALGITEQGKIYISENTEQLSSNYHRQCAEQNMVTIATQRDVYDQIKERIANGEDRTTIVPQNPKFREVFLMGGRMPDTPRACPCGNCTELLSKVMMPNAPIWILPVNDGQELLHIREDAEYPNQLNDDDAWKTNIEHLARNRYIKLDLEHAQTLRQSVRASLREVADWLSKDIEEDPNRAVNRLPSAAGKNVQKYVTRRSKSSEIYHGLEIDLGDLQKYLYENIMVTLADRLEALSQKMGLGPLKDLSSAQITSLASPPFLEGIYCSVVQLDNGKLYAAVDAKSDVDKAFPGASVLAAGGARRYTGTQGIKHCWMMEFSTHNAQHGQIETNSKISVERLGKQGSIVDGHDFGYLSFGSGQSHEKAQANLHTRLPLDLFPGGFSGIPETDVSSELSNNSRRPRPSGSARTTGRH